LNQVLLIILTVAAVVAVTFLVMFLSQLRRTAKQGEETLAKAQELMDGLKAIEAKINTSLDDVGQVLQTSKKAASGLSEITAFVTTKIIRPGFRYWPFVFPLLRLGWQQMKKRKERKHGG